MNGAENYIEHIRQTALKRTAIVFAGYTLLAFLCCGLSKAVFLRWETDVVWNFTPWGGNSLISAVLAQSPLLVTLLVRWAGAFTAFSRWISVLTAVLYGSAAGCCSAFLSRGLLSGIPPEQIPVTFGSLLILLLLCALSDLYADCLLTLSGIRERRIRFALTREYSLIFGILSGIQLLIGIAGSMLLS